MSISVHLVPAHVHLVPAWDHGFIHVIKTR